MTTRSTYEKVFEYLGTMSNELGSEISEFMNVFKMIHSHQGTSGDVPAGKVKPMGMITEEMVTIYDGFLAKLNEVTDPSTVGSFEIDYPHEYLPVMPDLMRIYLDNNQNSQWITHNLYPKTIQAGSGSKKLEVDVEVASNSIPNGLTVSTYKENVRDTLSKFTSPRVYKLFTTPVKDIDAINRADNKSFSDEFKALKIYQKDKSFFDYLMAFVENENIAKDESLPINDGDANKEELEDIFDMFEIYQLKDRPDHMNSLVIDIMENQKRLESKKERVSALRKKLYTYVSRDQNYTQVLNGEKTSMRLMTLLLVVVLVTFGVVAMRKNTSNLAKTTIISSIAMLILSIHIVRQIFGALTNGGRQRVKEGFENAADIGFTVDSDPNGDPVPVACNRVIVLANFIDKFSEILSREIKQEYFDALNDSQEKDMNVLKQLEREHQTNSHFHQLKNNLTHFKINEAREFKKMAWNGVLATCIIGLLFSVKLQRSLSQNMFTLLAGIVGVTYVTYCLLNYKSILLRDRQDWDRFHWVLNKIESNSASESCNGLKGFQRK